MLAINYIIIMPVLNLLMYNLTAVFSNTAIQMRKAQHNMNKFQEGFFANIYINLWW